MKSIKNFFIGIVLIAFSCSSPGKKENELSSGQGIKSLPPQEFKENLSNEANAILIDVRTPEEIAQGIIPGAVNLDIKDSAFTEKINALEKEKVRLTHRQGYFARTEKKK